MFRKINVRALLLNLIVPLLILAYLVATGLWVAYDNFVVIPRNESRVGAPGTAVFLNDGPYPSLLVVREVGISEIWGTLYILLPEGSSDPDIARYSKGESQAWIDPCTFTIDYTSREGTRKTLTWEYCSHYQGLEVNIDEIEVSVP